MIWMYIKIPAHQNAVTAVRTKKTIQFVGRLWLSLTNWQFEHEADDTSSVPTAYFCIARVNAPLSSTTDADETAISSVSDTK